MLDKYLLATLKPTFTFPSFLLLCACLMTSFLDGMGRSLVLKFSTEVHYNSSRDPLSWYWAEQERLERERTKLWVNALHPQSLTSFPQRRNKQSNNYNLVPARLLPQEKRGDKGRNIFFSSQKNSLGVLSLQAGLKTWQENYIEQYLNKLSFRELETVFTAHLQEKIDSIPLPTYNLEYDVHHLNNFCNQQLEIEVQEENNTISLIVNPFFFTARLADSTKDITGTSFPIKIPRITTASFSPFFETPLYQAILNNAFSVTGESYTSVVHWLSQVVPLLLSCMREHLYNVTTGPLKSRAITLIPFVFKNYDMRGQKLVFSHKNLKSLEQLLKFIETLKSSGNFATISFSLQRKMVQEAQAQLHYVMRASHAAKLHHLERVHQAGDTEQLIFLLRLYGLLKQADAIGIANKRLRLNDLENFIRNNFASKPWMDDITAQELRDEVQKVQSIRRKKFSDMLDGLQPHKTLAYKAFSYLSKQSKK